MRNNIIKAIYSPNRRGFSVCPAAYQWDYGLVLQVEGLTLPDVTEWHFGVGREAVKAIGNATSVAIPDECLKQTGTVPVYFFGHTGESDGETAYKLSLPVIERPKPSDVTPTPAQQDALDKAIAVLQAASDPFAYSDDGDGNIVIGEGATGGTTKALQSIQFPGLTDTYTVEGGSVDVSAILPTANASGAVAAFPDGSALMPAKDVKVTIEPKQAGTGDPSPENIREITGWDSVKVTRAGKNLLHADSSSFVQSGITYNYDAQTNTLTANGTAASTDGRNFGEIDVPSGQYVFKAKFLKTTGGFSLYLRKKNASTNIANIDSNNPAMLVNLDAGVYYVRVAASATGDVNATASELQLELGSTATTYEPYQSEDYTIPLGQTVYGGTLDVTTGELVVNRAIVTLNGTEQWKTMNSIFYLDVDAEYLREPGRNTQLCDRFKPIPQPYNTSDMASKVDNSISLYGGSADYWRIFVKKTDLEDVDALKSWLIDSNVKFSYILATPQTYHLTPQEITLLLGDNTVFADAGPIEVTYGADIQRYIDKKIAETQALILEN